LCTVSKQIIRALAIPLQWLKPFLKKIHSNPELKHRAIEVDILNISIF